MTSLRKYTSARKTFQQISWHPIVVLSVHSDCVSAHFATEFNSFCFCVVSDEIILLEEDQQKAHFVKYHWSIETARCFTISSVANAIS